MKQGFLRKKRDIKDLLYNLDTISKSVISVLAQIDCRSADNPSITVDYYADEMSKIKTRLFSSIKKSNYLLPIQDIRETIKERAEGIIEDLMHDRKLSKKDLETIESTDKIIGLDTALAEMKRRKFYDKHLKENTYVYEAVIDILSNMILVRDIEEFMIMRKGGMFRWVFGAIDSFLGTKFSEN